MDRSRIRWRNVGRLAAGVAGGGVLLIVGPGLLDPPEPPPLPADVGLATGASEAVATFGEPPMAAEATPPEPERRTRHRREKPTEAQGAAPGRDGRRDHDRDGRVRTPAAVPAPPAGTPFPQPTPPPTVAIAAPIPPPIKSPPPVAPAPASTGPAEFGFER
jgi:neural Wiskott-Aldrich syndrome protein